MLPVTVAFIVGAVLGWFFGAYQGSNARLSLLVSLDAWAARCASLERELAQLHQWRSEWKFTPRPKP